ncbi:zinc finger protein-like protein [Dinothrombium tinctorium]|uniref:Zinc finger protein 593 homolog n=1 Tax=Dinothrombium tinctorium TaxID=1965070 RepID=A0A3S3PJA5_9ACAR|nr:zinc finger protein-like protein [Dinothrombium tinctorium]RWS02591.1 zinc finger protein-like protein [Dinothrombium tinctorium]
MTIYARKKGKNGAHKPRINKTRNRKKDLDEIQDEIAKGVSDEREFDEDLPGGGQFYCVHCSRYFIDEKSITDHRKSKVHKRRLKELNEDPYSKEEAESAAGLGNYKRRKID